MTNHVYAERVRKALGRKLAKMSISELAIAAGVSYGWLCRFRSGLIKDPGYSRLEKLGDYLGVV